MPAKLTILKNQRFGRLVVIREVAPRDSRRFEMRCDCGNIGVFDLRSVRSGKTKSCGCYRLELRNNFKHGWSKTPEYNSWRGMVERCTNSNHQSYSRYGGRGIKVCERWLKFVNFIADMGPKPAPKRFYSLERNNNDKGYSLLNCSWKTALEQSRNKIRNGKKPLALPIASIIRKYNKGFTAAQIARQFKCGRSTIFVRLHEAGVKVRGRKTMRQKNLVGF